jgi:hypothetical protein
MSPSSSRRRQPLPQHRNRGELVKAVLVSAAIVAATAVVVWLLRPGPPGVAATGGVMNRQPRASWLVVGTLAAGGAAAYWVLHRKNRNKRRTRATLTIAFAGILVAAIVLGFVWPGGLLRHDVAPPTAQPEPTTTPTTPTTPTTHLPATGATGSTGATGTTGGTGSTGATGATGSTGSTGAAVTTATPPVTPVR